MPTTYINPFNGWKTIFQQIYYSYNNLYIIGKKIENTVLEISVGSEKIKLEVDIIGKLLFKIDGYNCIRYLEEILEVYIK